MRILPQEQAVLDRLAQRGPDLIERAVGWCAQNSGSRNHDGLMRQLEALEALAATLPCAVERVALPDLVEITDAGEARHTPSPPALRLTLRPEASVQVVMTGHYDTVFPADSAFQSVRTRDDGALWGPGIADMKGGISVMFGALEAFETFPGKDRVGWTVLWSPDEEIGSPGSAQELARLGALGHLGLTFEPALPDGSMAGARKGSANFHLVVRGKAAHAGRAFHEGRNAVAGAAMIAAELHGLNGLRDEVTINVSKISGGSALNVVADNAVVRFNVRVPDKASADWITAEVNRIVASPPFEGLNLHLHGGFTRPPKPMDAAQTELCRAVEGAGAALGLPIAWKPSGGVCEGNNLHAAGLPNIDTLGVRGGDIHSDQEFAWPESFVERAQLSALILMKVAGGEIDAHRLKALRLETL
ncbi:hydrolase [Brevundimonas sp. 2R-24]|uniref:Hydrolase n=1 Tax=Peiella sedimenti TaxID=3061083 RepID=A0ABT8SJ05_9CAUL|nr:hydrolase [Caulobacteraceae bacterium XZ-24]